MKSLAKLAVLALPVLVLASACTKEPNSFGPKNNQGLTVSFQIGGDATLTKAPALNAQSSISPEPIDISEESGIEGLRLSEEISSLDDYLYNVPATKSTPVFTENIARMYDKLLVSAYKGNTNTLWGNENVEYTNEEDNVWSHNYSAGTADHNLAWPESDPLVFVIKTPDAPDYNYTYSSNNIDGKTGVGTISVTGYTTPKSTDGENDAVSQNDFLFSTKQMAQDQTDNKVLLYHALTGVKFKINSTANESGVAIKSIDKVVFKGLYSKGDFTVTPAYDGYTTTSNNDNVYPTSADVVTWKNRTDKSNFAQSFVSAEQGVDLANSDNFPDKFNKADANENNLNNANATKTFFFIPQEINKSVTLTVTYTYTVGTDTTPKTATTDINFGEAVAKNNDNYEWLPGQLRTYTLNVGDAVSISIEDNVPDVDKKNNIVITNTNTATCYIRVAVVGNWFTDAGTKIPGKEQEAPIAITACDQAALQAVIDAKLSSANWKKQGNFYYYLYPLAGGKTITPAHSLFNQNTLDFSKLTKPYNNCHLEITVAAQAVLAAMVEEAWDTAGLGLKNTTQD